jgi:hypothetical protein
VIAPPYPRGGVSSSLPMMISASAHSVTSLNRALTIRRPASKSARMASACAAPAGSTSASFSIRSSAAPSRFASAAYLSRHASAIKAQDETRAQVFVAFTTYTAPSPTHPGKTRELPRARFPLPFPGADKYLARPQPDHLDLARFPEYKPAVAGDYLGQCGNLLRTLIAHHTQRPAADLFFAQRDDGQPEVEIVVADLITALWMQLAQAVIGEVELRLCQMCGEPFILRQRDRNDRVFCSGGCKFKSVYQRKRKAVAMHAAGAPIREIVKAVGAPGNSYRQNLTTIKRWIEQER